MKRSDLTILGVVAGIALLAAFWLFVLSPKRNHASELQTRQDELAASVQEQQQLVQYGQTARKDFGSNYRRLVVLGKAVPQDDDTPSLLVELQQLADQSGIQFRSIALGQAASTSAPAPTASTGPSGIPVPPAGSTGSTSTASTAGAAPTGTAAPGAATPTGTTGATGATGAAGATASTATAATTVPTAPATETAAASLPIGAAVGPAGLPTMPYNLKFEGDYFEIADFMSRLDGLVHSRRAGVGVDGRLLTVDGFNITGAAPHLVANLSVTTFLTPAAQGLTAGATPAGPASSVPAAVPAAATPSSEVPSATSTSTPAP